MRAEMTFAEFKKKWSRYTGKESSAYQEHFNDLCRLLGQGIRGGANREVLKRIKDTGDIFFAETTGNGFLLARQSTSAWLVSITAKKREGNWTEKS